MPWLILECVRRTKDTAYLGKCSNILCTRMTSSCSIWESTTSPAAPTRYSLIHCTDWLNFWHCQWQKILKNRWYSEALCHNISQGMMGILLMQGHNNTKNWDVLNLEQRKNMWAMMPKGMLLKNIISSTWIPSPSTWTGGICTGSQKVLVIVLTLASQQKCLFLNWLCSTVSLNECIYLLCWNHHTASITMPEELKLELQLRKGRLVHVQDCQH